MRGAGCDTKGSSRSGPRPTTASSSRPPSSPATACTRWPSTVASHEGHAVMKPRPVSFIRSTPIGLACESAKGVRSDSRPWQPQPRRSRRRTSSCRRSTHRGGGLGLGSGVALHHRSSTVHQIHGRSRCPHEPIREGFGASVPEATMRPNPTIFTEMFGASVSLFLKRRCGRADRWFMEGVAEGPRDVAFHPSKPGVLSVPLPASLTSSYFLKVLYGGLCGAGCVRD